MQELFFLNKKLERESSEENQEKKDNNQKTSKNYELRDIPISLCNEKSLFSKIVDEEKIENIENEYLEIKLMLKENQEKSYCVAGQF